MKIYIKLDMEGVTGVVSPEQVRPGAKEYEGARRLLMNDLVSALNGAFGAGAAEVVVYDMHADGRNVLLDALDGRVSVISGRPPPSGGFFYGLDESFDMLFLVGCHARAGAPGAVLPHTYEPDIAAMTVNGAEVGEIGLEAALAGEFGIPLALVTAGSGAVHETRQLLGDDVIAVEVKKAIDETSGVCMSAVTTGKLITEAAAMAVKRGRACPLMIFPSPVTFDVTFTAPESAADLEKLPDINRTDELTARTAGPDVVTAYRRFVAARMSCWAA